MCILDDFKIEKPRNLGMRPLVKMNGFEIFAKNRASSAWIGVSLSASSSRRFKSMTAALMDIIQVYPSKSTKSVTQI